MDDGEARGQLNKLLLICSTVVMVWKCCLRKFFPSVISTTDGASVSIADRFTLPWHCQCRLGHYCLRQSELLFAHVLKTNDCDLR